MLTNLHIAKCLAFLATLLMMLIPASSWGANYTSWNADSINTKLGACAQLRNTVIDTTDKHSGTGSAKWTSDNLQFDQVCYDVPSPAKYNGADGGWLYYRWWMKISPSFVWGNGTFKAKTGRVAPSGGTPSQVWTMYIEKQAIYVGECPMCQKEGNAVRDDPSAAYVSYEFQPSVNPAVTSWHEYIIGIKKQTSVAAFDGEFHFYIDGKQIGQVTQMKYCNTTAACSSWDEQWGGVMYKTYPQYNDASAGGVIWLDDLSTDDTWNSIFSGAAPPTGSGDTPPAAPTGLTIVP